jgi:glutamate--cysteine ligase
MAVFDNLLRIIGRTVAGIQSSTSVNYIPVPFIAGRAAAPMVLEAKRYHDLHSLLGTVSDRGREMMKGTAAIHLHASLTRFDELLKLWTFMCTLSRKDGFAMGTQRRDIWNRTDPSRCGLRCSRSDTVDSSCMLLEKLIRFALQALELRRAIPFESIQPAPSFEEFTEHFTTIFTDVRLNVKGMTLELRTLDSRPLNRFRNTWTVFLEMVQSVVGDNI